MSQCLNRFKLSLDFALARANFVASHSLVGDHSTYLTNLLINCLPTHPEPHYACTFECVYVRRKCVRFKKRERKREKEFNKQETNKKKQFIKTNEHNREEALYIHKKLEKRKRNKRGRKRKREKKKDRAREKEREREIERERDRESNREKERESLFVTKQTKRKRKRKSAGHLFHFSCFFLILIIFSIPRRLS